MEQVLTMIKKYGWLALFPAVLIIYSMSFRSLPILEREHSVLGDADAANYVRLIDGFDLRTVYGKPYKNSDRSIGDVAQKHKIHHVMYVFLASVVYWFLGLLFSLLGYPASSAMYSINAVVTCLNLLLIHTLFKSICPGRGSSWPFLLFYPLTLSTWVFGSIPESWPFTGTLILLFLVMLYRHSWSAPALSLLIGLFMLNNMTLIFLLSFLFMDFLRREGRFADLLRRSAVATTLAFSSWLGLLTALSFVEASFRPDNYAKYTLWFKQFTNPGRSIFDPYVWKSVLTNMYVTSVVSNQPDPSVPQEALRTTIVQGGLGTLAVALYCVLAAMVIFQAFRAISSLCKPWSPRCFYSLLEDKSFQLLLFCGVMIFVTIFLHYPSGFLYSTTVIPLVTLIIARYIDRASVLQMSLYYVTVVAMALNNADQVLTFRKALALMS